MSESSSAADVEEDDEFVIHTITLKDGNVQTPTSRSPSPPTAAFPGIVQYNEAESSSSSGSESPHSPESPAVEQTPKKDAGESNGKIIPLKSGVRRSQYKRVRFADDVKSGEPAAKITRLEFGEENNKVDGVEEELDEEMALFEAEVGALNGAGEDADVELAEIEDAREEATQKELQLRVKKLKERLKNSGETQGEGVAMLVAGEKVSLRKRDHEGDKESFKSNAQEKEQEDDEEIDLLADWAQFTR